MEAVGRSSPASILVSFPLSSVCARSAGGSRPPPPLPPSLTSHTGGRASFLSTSDRFPSSSSPSIDGRPSTSTSTSLMHTLVSKETGAAVTSSSFTSSSPSFSRLGYGSGFVSSTRRFSPTRRRSPGPGSFNPTTLPSSSPHQSLTSAAFHGCNHDGQHLLPRPSRPRTAPSTSQVTPPSVPFISPFFTQRPNPGPPAYFPTATLPGLPSRVGGSIALNRAERSTSLVAPSSADVPSPTAYDPSLAFTRPRPSSASSVQFRSLAERPFLSYPLTSHEILTGNPPLSTPFTPHYSHSEVHRPFTSSSPSSLPSPPSTAAFHPPMLDVDRWGRRSSEGSVTSFTPSPLSYRPETASHVVDHTAPAHSFARPRTTSASGGGPHASPALRKGHVLAPSPDDRSWESPAIPSGHGQLPPQPKRDSSRKDYCKSSLPTLVAGLTVKETDIRDHRSFLLNHSHVWV